MEMRQQTNRNVETPRLAAVRLRTAPLSCARSSLAALAVVLILFSLAASMIDIKEKEIMVERALLVGAYTEVNART
jgi:hypothetical protein